MNRDGRARTVRAVALGGALTLFRQARGWSVNDAAREADLAPMTWRRIENGQTVRDNSLVAVDTLLGLEQGTTRRALADDRLMRGVIQAATGQDVTAAGGLASFAEQTRTRSPQQERDLDSALERGLAMQRRATNAILRTMPEPTTGELVAGLLARLARLPRQTRETQALVRALSAAGPDLIAGHLVERHGVHDDDPEPCVR